MRVLHRIVLALAFAVSVAQSEEPRPDETPRRAILVTGASTGIGRATTELLAKNGFFVYAGARKAEDIQALSAIENVRGMRLDVTKQNEIDAAVKLVRDAGRGLFGLVNNAGVAVLGPMIEMHEDDLQFQFDVNVFGPYRVTKAFAPLLIESQGRITTTGSISGFVTWGMGGAYTMSKHAIEAYTDTLAGELGPFGVTVGIIEPGNYRSEIMKNTRQRLLDASYGGEGSLYRKQLERMREEPDDGTEEKDPDEVAQAMLRFFTDPQPKRRTMVVPNQQEADLTLKAAIARVVQLNAQQPYAYDREGLIALLDEAMRVK